MIEERYPVLPLRDVVVFPGLIAPLYVGRAKSIVALEAAVSEDDLIILLTQKSPDVDEPKARQLYSVGVLARVLHMISTPDGHRKILVEGQERVKVSKMIVNDDLYHAKVSYLPNVAASDLEMRALNNTLLSTVVKFDKQTSESHFPEGALAAMREIDSTEEMISTIASHLPFSIENKQKLLTENKIVKRHAMLLALMQDELNVMNLERTIRGRVKKQMDKSQREYYLNEKMKAIQHELGGDGGEHDELSLLEQRVAKSDMSAEARSKIQTELKKLKMMSPSSSEATVVRTYIDTLLSVPWSKAKRLKKVDINQAEQLLDEHHYGLEKVKERILEYLAVQQRVNKVNGMILCLVGPPGVGKTSLGSSIAEATGRKFTRMALGGVRDEAEIRGHRRTYIGAMPGKIIQNLSKVGTKNPLFLLDEVDKMSTDFRGDPASALLEVLDPEQNCTFNDNYLDVDYDLSDVMFVATANSLDIPSALLDRMEVIWLSGYTETEKLNIAKRYLLPKQISNNGIVEGELQVDDSAILAILRHYTREAGVRNLERELSKICRKVVKAIAAAKHELPIQITADNVDEYLGVSKYRYGVAEQQPRIGQVTGLAWTQVGGELLSIETAVVRGKGKLNYTGQLGEVMQESIQAAMTVVRAHAHEFGLAADFYEQLDVHVHVPEGATPKDGPSAGIAMCTALVSVLTQIAVRADVAMTGEITLRGEVLAIGGLKEKLLAAHRGGIKTVVIPSDNSKDLADIPADVLAALEIKPVRWVSEVLKIALNKDPFTNVAQAPLSVVVDNAEKTLLHH